MQFSVTRDLRAPEPTAEPARGELPPGTVSVESVTANGSRVEATIGYSDDLRRFFDESPFYVEYDVTVSHLPESVLVIPVLAQVCPVAWARGADVRVRSVDRRFLDSLMAVGRTLARMYPFMEGGRLVVEEAPEWSARSANGRCSDRPVPPAEDAGMLFTGGVDSMATYVRHREESPTLVTIQGWVVGVDDDERWRRLRGRTERFADRFGVDARFVRSNALEFLDTPMLSAHFDGYHDGSWYSAVGCGLGLLGLCAPMAVAEGIGRLYVGASVWEGMRVPPAFNDWDGRAMPWGSHPDIDDDVAWADSRGVHDAFELDRQGRIGAVAEYVRDHDPDLPIYSCSRSETAENCGRCEKCLRTALGLAVAGLDPADHGFEVDRSSFEHAVRCFERDEWLTDQHAPYHWLTFQERLSGDEELPMDGSAAFLRWLQTADFETMAGESPWVRFLHAAARHTPYPVYATAYPVYDSLRERVGRVRR